MARTGLNVAWEKIHFSAEAELTMPDIRYPVELGLTDTYVIPLTALQLDFALNSIPQATLHVATGRIAATGQPSLIHYLTDGFKNLIPVTVRLTALRVAASSPDELLDYWPDKPFIAFQGYVTGSGSQTAHGQAELALHCVHWLVDLAFSSAVSRSSTADNPAYYSFGASFRAGRAGVTDPTTTRAFYSSLMPFTVFSSTSIATDLWGKCLAPWYRTLCDQDRFQLPGITNTPADKNYEAIRALRGIEGYTDGPAYKWSQPLEIRTDPIGVAILAGGIGQALLQTTPDSLATTTLWDKLAGEHAAQFLFSVVPMVERALIVPFTAGLRTPYETIYASDYDSIAFESELTRPLKALALITATSTASGAVPTRPGQAATELGIGGYYETDEVDLRGGMTAVRQAPYWIAVLPAATFNARVAAAPGLPRGSAAAPGVGATLGDEAAPGTRYTKAKTFWNDFARTLYLNERLRGRRAIIQGKFRLDIAPGSTVCIETIGDDFVRQKLIEEGYPPEQEWYAHVTRVTSWIDCERMQAGTSFALSHWRSSTENSRDSTSTATHPLYINAWSGAPLTDFGEEDSSDDEDTEE